VRALELGERRHWGSFRLCVRLDGAKADCLRAQVGVVCSLEIYPAAAQVGPDRGLAGRLERGEWNGMR